jgi:hypothetical protein
VGSDGVTGSCVDGVVSGGAGASEGSVTASVLSVSGVTLSAAVFIVKNKQIATINSAHNDKNFQLFSSISVKSP